MPNVLGDSENYVAANPMQTPPAMESFIFLISPLFINLKKQIISLEQRVPTFQPPSGARNCFNQKISSFSLTKYNIDKGYIFNGHTKILTSKLKLLELLEKRKKKAILKVKTFQVLELKEFQLLVNGVFQAEGYVGGSFSPFSKYYFTPRFSISQNASLASIDFFCLLWVILDKKLRFSITKNHLSLYHIVIVTNNWDVIVNRIIPYLCFLYGNKHRGLMMLNEVYILMRSDKNLTNEEKSKIIIMGYNMVQLSKKKVSISEKFKLVLNEKLDPIYETNYLTKYIENDKPLSLLFLLGFILGDGSFSIRIRDSSKGIWFIPQFRIHQKNTKNNQIFFNNIVKYFENLSIKSNISFEKDNHRLLCLRIEGVANVKAFYSLLSKHSQWFFWKKSQFHPLDKYLVLSKIASRHWKDSQLALLRLIYFSNAFPKKNNNYGFWKDKLDLYFKNKLENSISYCFKELNFPGLEKKDLFYICMSKEKSWLVTLPSGLKIKPKAKYFFFKTYDNSKEKALKAAIEYRDNCLNNWLINNGFK